MSEILQARGRLGVASRVRDPHKITEARRDLAAAKLADYVAKIVDDAPPLTEAQRDRIASLLRPTGGGHVA